MPTFDDTTKPTRQAFRHGKVPPPRHKAFLQEKLHRPPNPGCIGGIVGVVQIRLDVSGRRQPREA